MRHTGFGIMMAEKNLLPARMLLRFKDEIALTAEQVSKIEKMNEAFQEAFIRRQADVKVQELKLNSLLKEEKVNRGKMEKLIRGIAKMKTDAQIDRINHLLDVKAVLTADQIKKIDEFKRTRMKRRMKDRKDRSEKRRMRRPRGAGSQ